MEDLGETPPPRLPTFDTRMTPWTQEEDTVLLQQIAVYGTKDQWRRIAEAIPGRTNKACRKRWLHSLSPDVKKTLWSADEDAALLALHGAYPGRWAVIARHIPGRTDDACSKRYREALDPSLRKDEWAQDEDALLLAQVERHKSAWTKVGQAMNRSSLACRNRYRMLQRKMHLQPVNTAPASPIAPPPAEIAPVEPEHEWQTPVSSHTQVQDCGLTIQWGSAFPYASQLIPSMQASPWQPVQPAPEHGNAVFFIDPQLEGTSTGSGGTSTISSPREEVFFHHPSPPTISDYGTMEFHGHEHGGVQEHEMYAPELDGGILDEHPAPDMQEEHAHPHPHCEESTAPSDAFGEDIPLSMSIVDTQHMQLDDEALNGAGPSTSFSPAGSTSPTATTAAPSPRPAKRRRIEAGTSRLSSMRAVTSDAAMLAYACGHPDCWPRVEREMADPDPAPASAVRFATSAELMAHKKAAHPADDADTDKIFRCALPGCGKAWKNINGIQYHLQVSRAHFRSAVNRAKCNTSGDPTAPAEHGRPKKVHRCPHDGCPNQYKQLSGLKYHLAHGHPEHLPLQLDELPHQLRRQLGGS
ncbi:hypothetical protein AURDEDRAFT_109532 [Auricularia subglabra TFB-10046 SS5]|nr:hypothetical protein AURDEDRAFT_109532 [Auricularia subglabra TFB-10046 SS5]